MTRYWIARTSDVSSSMWPLARWCAGVALIAAITATAHADTFGPDAFGYRAIDNVPADPEGFMFPSYDSISDKIGTPLTPLYGNNDDGVYGLEGDSLMVRARFYEINNQPVIVQVPVVVSTNGFISFDPLTLPDYFNDCPLPVPVAGGGGRIAALHDDLVCQSIQYVQMTYPHPRMTQGALPATIIQWDAQHYVFPPSGSPDSDFQFQVVLYENGDMLIRTDPESDNHEAGFSSTTGIQDDGATTGLTIHCNEDGSVPDGYAVLIVFPDCDGDGVSDSAEIAAGGEDCNGNGLPDECEIAFDSPAPGGPFFCVNDCDPDCNDNGVPDECETDCNGNGVPDVCEIRFDSPAPPPPDGPYTCTSNCDPDCNDNGIPDACETDCNDNGVPDDCDTEPTFDPATAMPRDDCADAEFVDPALFFDDPDFVYIGDTDSATFNSSAPLCGFLPMNYEVWYRYRPAYDGILFVAVNTVSNPPAAVPFSIAIHDGCPGTFDNRLGCVFTTTSVDQSLNINVTRAETYWIVVATNQATGVDFKIESLQGPPAVLNDSDFNRNGVPDECDGCLADVNGDFIVNQDDLDQVEGALGPCDGCPEDVNGTGVVDEDDLMFVQARLGIDCSVPAVIPCPPDVDGNGIVDFADILEIIIAWGPCSGACAVDVDGNGDADFADIFEVILAWGPCPTS